MGIEGKLGVKRSTNYFKTCPCFGREGKVRVNLVVSRKRGPQIDANGIEYLT